MANEEHAKILKEGVEVWNKWRAESQVEEPDLRDANLEAWILSKANLSGVIFDKANLIGTDLSGANLTIASFIETHLEIAKLQGVNLIGAFFARAHLHGAELGGANLSKAWLNQANLTGANLFEATLREATLSANIFKEADFKCADLRGADLSESSLISTNFCGAKLDGCNIYGISVWDLRLDELTSQENLVISKRDQPTVAVDDIEVAQFIYLLLNNKKIRNVIDTIGEKGVLILGRFTEERKAVLDAIRDKLRNLGFVPMMFDFEKPTQRDFTETIKTLAGLSRFIIADITNPKSSPLELQATMPDYMIPFVPIIQEDEEPFSMFQDLQQKYGGWVLDVLKYDSADNLLQVLDKAVIKPALRKADELLIRKAEGIRDRHVKDYM